MTRVCVCFRKRIRSTVVAALVCILAVTSSVLSKEPADSLSAGVAKVDITPQKSVRMSGYGGRKGLSQGVHDPLSARVVSFSSGGQRLVLVSTDLIGFYGGTSKYLREILLKEFDLNPSELFLSAIHTHAGPTPTMDEEKGHPNNVEYTKDLGEKLIEAVGNALDKMEPVCIDAAAGHSSIGSNRRKLVFDKAGNSSIVLGRNPYGVTDKEVLVMKVAKKDGEIIAALFDYAIHSTSLGSKNYIISGDVHGLAEQFVEKILGGNAIAPAFAGASGDINPWARGLEWSDTESEWIPEPVLSATMLGEEVVRVLREIKGGATSGEIKTTCTTLELPGKRKGELTIAKDCPPTSFSIIVARVGEIGFVGLGGEVLTEIGMAIKAGSPFEYTFVITHCNGAAGYLAPKHLYVEGGYEIKTSPFAPQAAERVVNKVVAMLHEL